MTTVLSVLSILQQFEASIPRLAGVVRFQGEEIAKGSSKENNLFLGTECCSVVLCFV
jgi:hypothetical protein